MFPLFPIISKKRETGSTHFRFVGTAGIYYNNCIMKVAFHTLGCKVNQYESEAMAQMFRSRGWEIADERDFADVYVINTCTVTATADKKSRQYIRRMKRVNPDSVVAVTGCFSQISPDEVSKIKGVDIITGTNEKSALIDYVEKLVGNRQAGNAKADGPADPLTVIHPYEELGVFEEMGTVASTENRTRAYIKVQEGCNRFCTYCVIPYARGPVRSRVLEDIVTEAKALIAAGYKELVLTGINTAMYDMEGRDLYATDGATAAESEDEIFGIEKAIAAINQLEGDFRIRLSSLEPAVVNADYVMRLFQYDKLCHHLHMSAQSGSDKVLQAMNRPYDRAQYLEMAKTLYDFDPCYGLSTDIIVGFPGEKEKDFDESYALVAECCFCRTHVFKYSKRPGTKAAEMKEHVSPQVKQRRSDELQDAAVKAARIFFEVNIAYAGEGRTETVLFEEIVEAHADGEGITRGDRLLTGYTGNYIRVYVPASEDAETMLGAFAKVRLEALFSDGVTASVVE